MIKKTLHWLWPPLALYVIMQLVFLTGFWQHAQNRLYDNFFTLRGVQNPGDSLLIVDIDDKTFADFNQTWPFPRVWHSQLVKTLEEAGAATIVFDVEFTERLNQKEDVEFIRQILACDSLYHNIVLAGKVAGQEDDQASQLRLVTPIGGLSGLPWGSVNVPTESGNYVRRYSFYQSLGERRIYSLGSAALINHLRLTPSDVWSDRQHQYFKNLAVPINANATRINYCGPARTIQTVSYSDLFTPPQKGSAEGDDFFAEFDDELAAQKDRQAAAISKLVRGRIVFVGTSTEELHDLFYTPFGVMPGVEVQANFVNMVLTGRYLHECRISVCLLAELLLLLGLYYLNRRVKPQWSGIYSLAGAGLAWLVAWLLFLKAGLIIPALELPAIIVVIYLVSLLYHYLRTSRERAMIKRAFAHYMAPELVTELLKDPGKLRYGGEEKQVTVLFSDIRSFTTYSEKHTADQTVGILRQYLTAMVDEIIAHNGMLDKFVGDEIMALYNVPVPRPHHALEACCTALAMRNRLNALQQEWESSGLEPFEIGIGINTGPAVVGNLGSEQIFDYTAIGDTINLGARLESINKEYQTRNKIIISEFTFAACAEQLVVTFLDEVRVKGKNKPVKIYALEAIRP